MTEAPTLASVMKSDLNVKTLPPGEYSGPRLSPDGTRLSTESPASQWEATPPATRILSSA